MDPDQPVALMYLGDTWYRRGAYDLAQPYFEASLAIQPSAPAFRFLADAILRAGEAKERANAAYREALHLDPAYSGAEVALQDLEESKSETWFRRLQRMVSEEGRPADAEAIPEAAQEPPPLSALRWSDDGLPRVFAEPRVAVSEDDSAARPHAPAPEAPAASRSDAPGTGDGGTGQGARVLAGARERYGPAGFLDLNDDAFERWLATAHPDQVAGAMMTVLAIAFQYQFKDNDLVRAELWVRRQIRLGEALPPTYGPAEGPYGLGRDRLLGDAYQAYGNILQARDRAPEALAWLERALALFDAEVDARKRAGLAGDAEFDRIFDAVDARAALLEDLARVCGVLGDMTTGEQYLERARRVQEDRPTTEAVVYELVEKATARLAEGNADAAFGLLHRALDRAEEAAGRQVVPRMLATVLNALGRAHAELRLYRTALAYHERARRLNEWSGHTVRLTWDHLAIARVFRRRPDLGDPRDALERALRYASVPHRPDAPGTWRARDGDSYLVADATRAWPALLELAGLLEDEGDLDAAAAILELATEVAGVARASAVDDTQRIAVANRRRDAFAALARIHLRRSQSGGGTAAAVEAAWRANETMRARTFLDALGDDDLLVPAEVPASLIEREAAALRERRELLSSRTRDVRFWDGMRDVQTTLSRVWDEMIASVPAATGYVDVRRAEPASAADVHAVIAADPRPTTLVNVIVPDPAELAVIALRSGAADPVVASLRADIPRIERFIAGNLGSAGRARELAQDLPDLFRHEMRPLTDLLGQVSDPGDVLAVCPFGGFNYVPFAALHVDGTPLVERNPLAVLPSASLVRALRTAAGTPPRVPAAVFGDPTGDLSGARAEAAAVAGIFGEEALLGDRVTSAAVRAAFARAGTVHVAAHAHFDEQDPLASGILLADGILSAREILAVSAHSLSLVTLSACETGINLTNPAQELLGLSRAVMFAGADSLVVSLWKVPDAATVEIMSAFYRSIRNDTWKADALQAAALHARELCGPDRFDQWGAFQLVGEWR